MSAIMPFEQPEIEPIGAACLQYQIGDVMLDVWTDFYNGRRTLEGVAVPGTRINIVSLLSAQQQRAILDHCDRTQETPAQLARDFAEDMNSQRKREAA